MRKWRPTHKAIYVIPEVRGNAACLELILNRILPLRIFKNQEDMLIMLGDYIDGDGSSSEVIDSLINIKEAYGDRVVFLKGNHEAMMLNAYNGSNDDFHYWTDNGGFSTIDSYLKKAGLKSTSYSIGKNRLSDIIPKDHIDFLSIMKNYFIIDNYCFFHGGFDPNKTIADNNLDNFIFDFTSSKYVKKCVKNNESPIFKDDYIFIGNHNYMEDKPFIHSKYFMLGGSAPGKLIVFELNSMTASAAKRGKSRIYKYNFNIHE